MKQITQRASDNREISISQFMDLLLTNARLSVATIVLGTMVGIIIAQTSPVLYTSTARIVAGGSGATGRGATLAQQFGISLPSMGGGQRSAQFYASMVLGNNVLARVAEDTLTGPSPSGAGIKIADYFEVPSALTATARGALTIRALRSAMRVSADVESGIVQLSTTTTSPVVSQEITAKLAKATISAEIAQRSSSALEELRYYQSLLAQSAERRLKSEQALIVFELRNKNWTQSPVLTAQYRRLEKENELEGTTYTAIRESVEQNRLASIRNVPSIMLLDSASYPALPDPRQRLAKVFLGFMAGITVAIVAAVFRRRPSRET